MTDRPYSPETAAAVRRYLGAFLAGDALSDAQHDVVTDVQYWGDTDHLEVLRIAHGVLTVRARVTDEVAWVTLTDDLGLGVQEALEVMGVDEPPELGDPGTTAAGEPHAQERPEPEPVPEPEPEPVPEPEPIPEPEPEPVPESEPEPVISIDAEVLDEQVVVDADALPTPVEPEGRPTREQRRRLAREAEAHERRAREAEATERRARAEAGRAEESGTGTTTADGGDEARSERAAPSKGVLKFGFDDGSGRVEPTEPTVELVPIDEPFGTGVVVLIVALVGVVVAALLLVL